MKEFLTNSAYFGLLISIIGYAIGSLLQKKLRHPLVNPLLTAIIFVIAALLLLDINYGSYYESAGYLSYLLTPATVCLSVPLYRRLEVIKKNAAAIGSGIAAGVIAGLASVAGLSYLFGLTHEQYVTLLPKSITTAIGVGVSQELGGIPSITVAAIVITGIIGNVTATGICRLFRIKDPLAKGLAIGTASHAIGTSKAMEMGETEGAASSLAIVVTGLITVALAPVFSLLI